MARITPEEIAERRAEINRKSGGKKERRKPVPTVAPSEIRWVADQLQALSAVELDPRVHLSGPRPVKVAPTKPPSHAASNLLQACLGDDQMKRQFWLKFMAISQAETIKKVEAKKMEDDQRESFSLIEMWKREMPGYLERKALHDAAQATEAEKRRNRAQRLAEFQSGGGRETQAKVETETPAAGAAAREDGSGEDAGQGGDESREEARSQAESPAESEAAAV